MNRQELRDLQDPLKARYREDASTALVTLRVEGTLGEGVTCSVATGQAFAVAGLHPASGGRGLDVCSGDMLLQALAACAGVTLQAVATSLEISVAGGTVHAEGDLDFAARWPFPRTCPSASERSACGSYSTRRPRPSSSTRC